MPRNSQISKKSKEGKEFQRKYSREKKERKSKKAHPNVNQESCSNSNCSNGSLLNEQIQNMSSNSLDLQGQNSASCFNQNAYQYPNSNFTFTPTQNPVSSSNFQGQMLDQANQFSANSDLNSSGNQLFNVNMSPMIQKPKRQKFTSEEDNIILELVGDNKFPNWNEVAAHIKGRTGRQCRERYQHYLSPTLSCEPWTLQEDKYIYELYNRFGSQWALIAQYFNGRRTNNSIKNRWNNHIKFFKDSLMNDEINKHPTSDVKKEPENNDDSTLISNSNNQFDASNNNSCSNVEQNTNGNFMTQQQGMLPLTTTPHTPKPQVSAISFNVNLNDDNTWSFFDQKGSINSSSSTSELLPKIEIKANNGLEEKSTITEKKESNKITSINFTVPSWVKENANKEDKEQIDKKTKAFDEEFLYFINNGSHADIDTFDFDFLMY